MRGLRATAARLALTIAAGAVLLAARAPAALAITATAKPPAAVEGGGLTATVATFTDGFLLCASVDQYSARITWGDGTTTSGVVGGGIGSLLAPCLYTVDGAHTYAEEGQVSYSVAITGPAGASDTGPAPVVVHDAPLSARGISFGASQGASRAATVATFTDADPAGVAADFSAAISWGDGTSGPGAVTAAPGGGFAVAASHAYARSGSFNVSVTITDGGGSQATTAATATVLAAPAQPPVRPSPPAALRLGLSPPLLARGGTVVVGVRCPAVNRLCRGRLVVATVANARSRLPALRRSRTLGTTLFIIPGGRRAELSVRPKRAFVALLRLAGSVEVSAAASSFDAITGLSQVSRLTTKLVLAGRRT